MLGTASWAEAFAWLEQLPEPIEELQYWGHGHWGSALVGSDVLSASDIGARDLTMLREKLRPDALIWFRTCETFGAKAGIAFAERLADFTGARVAGHTHVIGFHQSGLHGLAPGVRADWAEDEGLLAGTPESPLRARGSKPWRTHTITCLSNRVPEDWFSRGYRAAAPA